MTVMHDNVSRDTGFMRRKFYEHLVIYLVVNAVLCALDVLTGTDKLWFYWVLGGWGIGIAAHAMQVFGHRSHPQHGEEYPSSSQVPKDSGSSS